MSSRERLAAVALAAVGAGLTVTAAGRTWASVAVDSTSSVSVLAVRMRLTGGELSGAISAFGLAGLAAVAALFATRGRIRAGVGVLLAIFGACVVYFSATATRRGYVIDALGDKSGLARVGDVGIDLTAWWLVAVAGGVLLAAAGVLTAVRGHRWPSMSARYETAGAAPRETKDNNAAAMWKSMDRGEDPTQR